MEQENKVFLEERYCLTMERIHGISTDHTVPTPFSDYFQKTAGFLIQMEQLKEKLESGETDAYTLEQWQELNRNLYADIMPEHYETSYGNPAYAVAQLGEVHGRILSFLYTELRGLIVYIFEGRLEETVVLLELFMEVYNRFEQEEMQSLKTLQVLSEF